MNDLSFKDKWTFDRLKYLQNDFGYPTCDMTPMTQDDIKNLKIGTACYVISGAGLRIAMFSYPEKGRNGEDDKVAFYTSNGTDKYKVKNAGKTYNVFRAHVN